jgi:hypothetical protein
MKRLFLAGLLALAISMALAGPAAANKNKLTISATCNGSQPVTVFVNNQANENSAAPVAGGGSFKPIEGHFFLAGTSTEAFSFTTNFPKDPTVRCTGSFVDPESGTPLDFVVTGVLRPAK